MASVAEAGAAPIRGSQQEKRPEAIREKRDALISARFDFRLQIQHLQLQSLSGRSSMAAASFNLSVVNCSIRGAFDSEYPKEAPLRPGKRVIHQCVVPWILDLEFHYFRSARWNQ